MPADAAHSKHQDVDDRSPDGVDERLTTTTRTSTVTATGRWKHQNVGDQSLDGVDVGGRWRTAHSRHQDVVGRSRDGDGVGGLLPDSDDSLETPERR